MAFTFVGLMLALKFPMTEEGMNEVRRKLDEECLAKAALGEPTDEVAEEFAHEHPREAVEFVGQHPGTSSPKSNRKSACGRIRDRTKINKNNPN